MAHGSNGIVYPSVRREGGRVSSASARHWFTMCAGLFV